MRTSASFLWWLTKLLLAYAGVSLVFAIAGLLLLGLVFGGPVLVHWLGAPWDWAFPIAVAVYVFVGYVIYKEWWGAIKDWFAAHSDSYH